MSYNIREIFEKVYRKFPSEWCYGIVKDISKFHRIQVSEGYEKAVKELCYILENEKIPFELKRYPFDKNSQYFFLKGFPKWSIKKGFLKLISPEHLELCEFNAEPLSIIPRSKRVKGIFEIVELDSYKGSLKNKLLLTDNFKKGYDKIKGKNAGILYYGMSEIKGIRERYDLKDYIHYVSFWEEDLFGFALSPSKGLYLKSLISKNKKLKAEVFIDSDFDDGEIEIIDIFFKGKSKEEILGVAHLCHPAFFANDNSSGSGVILGIAKMLSEYRTKLKRGIRLLLIPEITGSLVYLYYNYELLENAIGLINLDMVGESQELCRSSMNVIREPYFLRTYISYIGELIKEFISDNVHDFSGSHKIELFRRSLLDYAGGSDHYIFISPDFGIPSIMLNYWPDRFYHTTADKIDKVSSESLKISGTFAFTFFIFLSLMENKSAEFLKNRMFDLFKRKIYELKIKDEPEYKYVAEVEGFKKALFNLKMIYPNMDIKKELKELEYFIKKENIEFKKRKIKVKDDFIPVKKYKGPPVSLKKFLKKSDLKRLDKFLEENKNYSSIFDIFSYLIDGKRKFSGIVENAIYEFGEIEIEKARFIFEILEKSGFIKII